MSDKVLVVGSGAQARISKAERIYFANYSHTAFSDEEIIATRAKIIGFWSAPAVFPEFFPSDDYISEHFRQSLMRPIFSDRLVACTSQNHIPQRQLGGVPVRLMLPSDISAMMASSVRKNLPFISLTHFLAGAAAEPRKFRKLIFQLLRHWSRDSPNVGFNSYFRPSTGMLALCHAIATCGPEKSYILSGFEFGRRSSHVQGPAFHQKSGWYRNHVIADRKILKMLSKKFSIQIA